MRFSVLHKLKFDEFYLEWNANSLVYLHYKSTTSKIHRALFGQKVGSSKYHTSIKPTSDFFVIHRTASMID